MNFYPPLTIKKSSFMTSSVNVNSHSFNNLSKVPSGNPTFLTILRLSKNYRTLITFSRWKAATSVTCSSINRSEKAYLTKSIPTTLHCFKSRVEAGRFSSRSCLRSSLRVLKLYSVASSGLLSSLSTRASETNYSWVFALFPLTYRGSGRCFSSYSRNFFSFSSNFVNLSLRISSSKFLTVR